MRSLLLSLGLALGCAPAAYAQDGSATEPDPAMSEDGGSKEASAPSNQIPVTLRLKNGVTMRGSVEAELLLTWTAEMDVPLVLEDGTSVVIPGANIRSFISGDGSASEPAAEIDEPATGEAEEAVVSDDDTFSFPNAAATRYLYAPSAIPMQKGQGYVSQKLLITSVAYAVADHTTFVLGTFSLFPPLLTVAAVKTAFPVGDNVHLGIGGETFLTSLSEQGSQSVASVAFSNVTFGDLDTHVTLATGYLNFNGDDQIPMVLAGHHRISDRIAFVTENWLVVDPGNRYRSYSTSETVTTGTTEDGATSRSTQRVTTAKTRMSEAGPLAGLISASVRFIGRRDWETQLTASGQTVGGYPKSTVDVGLVAGVFRDDPSRLEYTPIGPIPWVDWSWHFGPARR